MQSLLKTFALLFIVSFTSVAVAADLPVVGAVTSGVGWRPDPFGTGKMVYHRGIDIAVPEGTPVRPTVVGTVTHAGPHSGHGLTVIVSHPDGSETLYGHNSKVLVAKGEQVDRGTVIALSGNTGRSTGPHVHYEVRRKGVPEVVPPLPVVARASTAEQQERSRLRSRSDQRLVEISESIRTHIYGFAPVAPQHEEEVPEDEV